VATITPQLITNPQDTRVKIFLWETLTDSDTATPVVVAGYQDKSVQVFGTFGGATVTIEGSNVVSTPTYATLDDANDNNLAFTSAGIEEITAACYQIRPAVTGGTAEDIDVYLYIET